MSIKVWARNDDVEGTAIGHKADPKVKDSNMNTNRSVLINLSSSLDQYVSGPRRLVLACSRRYAAVLCLLLPSVALASTATSSMTVSATVVASCTVSTTAMAFGNYNGAQLTNTATITATCTNTTPYNIGLNAGLASGATVTTRGMFVSGTPSVLLNYALFSNSGRTTNWGSTVGTDTVSGTGNGAAQALTVYGQISAGQLVAPGSYADTITATITY